MGVGLKKTCTKCGIEKELNEFLYRKKTCKKCNDIEIIEYVEKNKQKKANSKSYKKQKTRKDAKHRLKKKIQCAFVTNIKKEIAKKTDKMFKYTNVSYSDYIEHFKNSKLWPDYENGMNIEIDHIIPQRMYDLTNIDHVNKCWNKRNLQLLPAKENRLKKGKLDYALIEEHDIMDLLPDD